MNVLHMAFFLAKFAENDTRMRNLKSSTSMDVLLASMDKTERAVFIKEKIYGAGPGETARALGITRVELAKCEKQITVKTNRILSEQGKF